MTTQTLIKRVSEWWPGGKKKDDGSSDMTSTRNLVRITNPHKGDDEGIERARIVTAIVTDPLRRGWRHLVTKEDLDVVSRYILSQDINTAVWVLTANNGRSVTLSYAIDWKISNALPVFVNLDESKPFAPQADTRCDFIIQAVEKRLAGGVIVSASKYLGFVDTPAKDLFLTRTTAWVPSRPGSMSSELIAQARAKAGVRKELQWVFESAPEVSFNGKFC